MPGLIPEPTGLWLVVTPVDLRWGADRLSLYVQQVLRADPGAGNAYLFRNSRGNRIKLLVWDGTGVWLCQRRLHRGQFMKWSSGSSANRVFFSLTVSPSRPIRRRIASMAFWPRPSGQRITRSSA